MNDERTEESIVVKKEFLQALFDIMERAGGERSSSRRGEDDYGYFEETVVIENDDFRLEVTLEPKEDWWKRGGYAFFITKYYTLHIMGV